MTRLFAAVVVSTFGLGALSVLAADLTADESSELRQRAERLQVERARNPGVQSDVMLDRPRGDVRLNQQRGEVKMKAKKSVKVRKSRRSMPPVRQNAKRTLKEIPGALVRK